jgi:hypothetical protein
VGGGVFGGGELGGQIPNRCKKCISVYL